MLHASLAPVALAALLALGVPVFAQPVIITQPKWQTNVVGSTATFTVEAIGAPPLSYQWRFNGADRTGATEATLLVTNVQTTSLGLYSVVVAEFGGLSVTSVVARLYVTVPPSIATQPSNQTLEVGGSAVFAVQAAGTAPLRYQWRFNGVNLQAKTNTTLSLANVGHTNAGGYTVVVTNTAGAATSQVASLTVVPTLHGFSSIKSLADQTILLTLAGQPRTLFTAYFDLYPIDTSTNLLDWTPMVMLQRTNSSTNAFTYTDSEAAHPDKRFYRIATNQLVTFTAMPTGPFPVGVISRLLTDSTRSNRYGISTNSSFMVSYWYPARAEAGHLPSAYQERQLAEDPGYAGPYTDRVPYFVTHSLPSSEVSSERTNYPVIIYSHGLGGTRAHNIEKYEVLASHGYIVVSADHADANGTVFPDGSYLHGTGNADRPAFLGRVQDLRIVLADLERLNAIDPVLAGRVSLNNVGVMGFSFGGGAAAELCRTENHCRAALLLDAYLQGADELVQLGLQKPVLCMYNSNGGDLALFNKATQEAVWFLISDTVHLSFSSEHSIVDPGASNREAELTMNAYLVSFFNKYLKLQDDHLLDGPSTNLPRVINFMRK